MKYLCLVCEGEEVLNASSREEWSALRSETLAYVEDLTVRGHLLSTEPLQTVKSAATVRVRNGAPTVTTGPLAETTETLGGFSLVEAKDLNEALRTAGGWPSARSGSIEVRPVAQGLPEERPYQQ